MRRGVAHHSALRVSTLPSSKYLAHLAEGAIIVAHSRRCREMSIFWFNGWRCRLALLFQKARRCSHWAHRSAPMKILRCVRTV
jgi:hypothetical protein